MISWGWPRKSLRELLKELSNFLGVFELNMLKTTVVKTLFIDLLITI